MLLIISLIISEIYWQCLSENCFKVNLSPIFLQCVFMITFVRIGWQKNKTLGLIVFKLNPKLGMLGQTDATHHQMGTTSYNPSFSFSGILLLVVPGL